MTGKELLNTSRPTTDERGFAALPLSMAPD
jgi:hypothetical protein